MGFRLFDSEGVALVNLLSDGSGALDQMRERARDLGIVLDEHLVRDAERARTELDTLAQVVSANLTRAALEAAPVIADLSSWLADVAGKAGIAWERLFDAPEDKSLRTLRYELGRAARGRRRSRRRSRRPNSSKPMAMPPWRSGGARSNASAIERNGRNGAIARSIPTTAWSPEGSKRNGSRACATWPRPRPSWPGASKGDVDAHGRLPDAQDA